MEMRPCLFESRMPSLHRHDIAGDTRLERMQAQRCPVLILEASLSPGRCKPGRIKCMVFMNDSLYFCGAARLSCDVCHCWIQFGLTQNAM